MHGVRRNRRIIVVDGRPLVRQAVALTLSGRIAAVVTATDSLTAAVDLVEREPTDAVVVWLERAGDAEAEALAAIRRLAPRARLVAVLDDAAPARPLLNEGLLDGVSVSARGIEGLVRAVTGTPARQRDQVGCPLPRMTPRQAEVLRMVASGLTAREISEEMRISRKTVENHKQRLFRRLNVQSQSQAVAVAVRAGLLAPGLER
jgi:DNA-binding NarL/FixJ family response regulator